MASSSKVQKFTSRVGKGEGHEGWATDLQIWLRRRAPKARRVAQSALATFARVVVEETTAPRAGGRGGLSDHGC